MGQSNSPSEGSAPQPVSHKQCPHCGFNNSYHFESGPPFACEECEEPFADPMEARAAYDTMFGRGFRFNARRWIAARWDGLPPRVFLLGVALGTVATEIARRLWQS